MSHHGGTQYSTIGPSSEHGGSQAHGSTMPPSGHGDNPAGKTHAAAHFKTWLPQGLPFQPHSTKTGGHGKTPQAASEADPFLQHGNLDGDVRLKGPPDTMHLSSDSDAAPGGAAGGKRNVQDLMALFPTAQGLKNVFVMVLVPWLSFLVVCCCVAFAAPGSLWQIFGYVAAMFLATLGFLFINVYFATGKSQQIYLYLGLVTAAAVLLGLLVGRRVFAEDMSEYWLKGNRPTYGNVSPTAAAAAFPDAGTIHFTVDARVDLRRVMGFRPQGDPDMYCVAPILEEGQLEQVSFWAVGVNCCGAAWDFRCDGALDPRARSGAVVSGSGPEAATERNGHFFEAAKQAAARYHIITPAEPVLVRWLQDPYVASTEMLAEALQVVGLLSFTTLLAFVFLAGLMHWSWAAQRRKT